MPEILKSFNDFILEMKRNDQMFYLDYGEFLMGKLKGKSTDLDFTYTDLIDILFVTQCYFHLNKSDILRRIHAFCLQISWERNQLLEDILDFTYLNQMTKNPSLTASFNNHPHILEVYNKLYPYLKNEQIAAYIKDNNNLNHLVSTLVKSSLFSEITLKMLLIQKQKFFKEQVASASFSISCLNSSSSSDKTQNENHDEKPKTLRFSAPNQTHENTDAITGKLTDLKISKKMTYT